MIRDGAEYYVLVSSVREDAAKKCQKAMDRAFSTFDLSMKGGC